METWEIIVIILAELIVISAIVLIVYTVIKKKKIRQSEERVDAKIEDSTDMLALTFGGKENIKEITSRGSRVTVTVIDLSLVDKGKINQELESVMFMGNKIVFVIGSKSEQFRRLLSDKISNEKAE